MEPREGTDTQFVTVVGTTATAQIEGISAAGASQALLEHTPAADAEIIEYGQPVHAPVTPVSPAGCPTPAVITRAVRELIGFEHLTIDAGLTVPTAAPTIEIGPKAGSDITARGRRNSPAGAGNDIRDPIAVSRAAQRFEKARRLGRTLPADRLLVGESIPGGTTTAMAVLRALGESYGVSSSLPENPVGLKSDVVSTALAASDLGFGDADGQPVEALRTVGDPVLTAVSGLVVGACETDTSVTLAGGTQLLAAAAVVRHAGCVQPLELATTSFVADDESVDLTTAARDLELSLTITDPAFPADEHVVFEQYCHGVAKEGAGMGGALALYSHTEQPFSAMHEQTLACYEEVLADSDD